MLKDMLLKQFKLTLRNRQGLFWTMIFPFILGTLFFFAFRNIISDEIFVLDPIPVAVVEKGNSIETENFKLFLEEIGSESRLENEKAVPLEKKEDPLFYYIPSTMKEADKMMEDALIYGTIVKSENTEFILAPSEGEDYKINIVESVLNRYEQNYSAIADIMEKKAASGNMDPGFPAEAMKILSEDHSSVIKDITPKKLASPYIILFFSLMGYTAMLAITSGITLVSDQLEADLTDVAMRQELSPIPKMQRFLIGAFPRLILQMIITALLFLYLNVLGVSFGDQTGLILLITEIGVITGFFIGTGLATSFRKSKNILLGLGTAIPLLLASLAGMMAHQVKYYVQKYAPWIQEINPINKITDGIYSLFYYEGYERYLQNITVLLMITAVFVLLTLFNLRRNQYEKR